LVVAVASKGGLAAVSRLLEGLPASFEVPLLLVQHRTPSYPDDQYVAILQRHSPLPVQVARPGAAVQTGVTLLASGALVTVDEELRYHSAEAPTASIRGRRGDALFTSAASALGSAVIGLVLSGNLADGSEGARAIKRAGGRILAQEPGSTPAPSMPTSAIATGCVDHVLSISGIAAALVAFTMAFGAAELFAVPTPPWARLTA
jgi:two-component system chemotaxis response regulator CheB